MLGVIYGILAAATFGFNNASARRGVLSGTALQGLAISLPLGILVFVIGATVVGEWHYLSNLTFQSIYLFSSAGFMHFVFGRYCNIRSLAAVGSNLAGPVQQLQHLIAIILAIIFLGEVLSPLKLVGIILIFSAPAYIIRNQGKSVLIRDGSDKISLEPTFTPRMLEGYTFAFLTAIGFGSSSALVKAGLDQSNLSFLGGFISYLTAIIILLIILIVPSQLSDLKSLKKESFKWFMFSGIGSALSQMFRYLALSIAPVTIVQPLNSLSLIFRMIFGYFLNREQEKFDRFIVTGIFISFLGVLFLTISSEIIVAVFNAPDWVIKLSRLTWP